MNHKRVINNLRTLAVIEGISLLILFFIAMPLKYYFELPQAVTTMGWIHGSLFMGLVAYALKVAQNKEWSELFLFMIVLSSMVPFGMVFMDRKLKERI